ncbi:transcriptional regulator [Flavobacterium sp.]|uniref:transcriptional regulator n=1 Tax=Flavobacterium sp. TaxID=239 RepID=UPI0037501D96
MNYIKHLTGFFEKIVNDHSLNPTHISLYISLFQCWNTNRFQNPISITRDEVMRISKICSRATYHKCIRELHEKGYIKYEPSYNPFRGSLVYLFNFEENLKPVLKKARKSLNNELVVEHLTEQALNKLQTGTLIGSEQALVSSLNIINNTNIINDLNLGEQTQNLEKENLGFKNEVLKAKEKKLREKKKEDFVVSKKSSRAEPRDEKPASLKDTQNYFLEKNYSEIEAEKFYNHFQSNGWLVGGKSKMKDWKAAARNWMLNAQKYNPVFNQPQPQHLHTVTQKNYGEPL